MKSQVLEHINNCNCSRFAHSKVFYKLKKCFLEKYGQFVGYTEQYFETTFWDWQDDANITGYHHHILADYMFLNQTFHLPTPEFLYYQDDFSGYEKKSPFFYEVKALCTSQIEGRKQKPTNKEAFESLKWLIKWYRTQEQSQLKLSL
jgi:hypothetical protein